MLAPLEDACTVVLLRDGADGPQTLLLERPRTSRAFGGAWVFPGGKVDPADRVAADGTSLDDLAAAQRAGLRELFEETGQRLDPAELAFLSQWTPLQNIPRRFRTWHMLAPAASWDVVLNPAEHANHLWTTPAQALARHARRELTLIPPTWVTLHHLSAMESTAQALAAARTGTPFIYQTRLLGDRGVMWAGDEDHQAPEPHEAALPLGGVPAGGVPGARHRLTTAGLPWVFERSGFDFPGSLDDGPPAAGS